MTVRAPALRPTYWWIQYLRGLAATGVVIFHAYDTPMVPLNFAFEIGRYGVDVFFVISGFIMYSAAREERVVQFISRRLIRVFPLFWLATLVSAMIYLTFDGGHASGTEAVLSLALIPHYSEAHPTQIWPILIPGWTLSYEMFFYGLFALGIATRRVLAAPSISIVVLVALGVILKPHLALLVVVTNPLLFEFLIGLLIAAAVHRRPILLPAIAFAGVAIAITSLTLDWTNTTVFAASAAIVSGAVWCERAQSGTKKTARKIGPRPVPVLTLLGDASYSVYLFHTSVLLVIERLLVDKFAGASQLSANAIVILAITVAIGVGILLHRLIEKPLMQVLNGWNRRLVFRFASPATPPIS